MKPNTFHYVVTLENSITIGRHFYCTSNILQSVIGIIHVFLMGNGVTNVIHQDALQSVLRRLMGMWCMRYGESSYAFDDHHTPDVSTPIGLQDFMALGNMMELGRVLDRRTYTEKGINKKEGAEMIASRLWYRGFQTTYACKYRTSVGGRPTNPASIFKRSLVEFAASVVTYKRELDTDDDQRFFPVALEKEMKKFFRINYPELVVCYEKLVSDGHKYLSWSGDIIHITPRSNTNSRDEFYNFTDLNLYDITKYTDADVQTHLDTIQEDEMEVDDSPDAVDSVAPRSKTATKPRSQGPPVRTSKRIQERASSAGKPK
jgi:hypothetical protein